MKLLNVIMSLFFVFLGFLLGIYGFTIIIAGLSSLDGLTNSFNRGHFIGQFISAILLTLFGLWLFMRGLKGLKKPNRPDENSEYLDQDL